MDKSWFSKQEWMDFEIMDKFLSDRHIEKFCNGPIHNRTDGEYQVVYEQDETGSLFICHANVYDRPSFLPLFEWADQYSYIIKQARSFK
ncbi:MAG TPA: hypothetical protein ENI07_23780 [Desulfobacterales bacterium]|nr:hypothetical protein [Desulfobacterales bacterium]